MRALLIGILGLVVGSVGSVFLLFFAYILFVMVTGFDDFEGAASMGLATFVAPVAALVGGIAGAALFVLLWRRPWRPVEKGATPPQISQNITSDADM